jgi:hypothetical protein
MEILAFFRKSLELIENKDLEKIRKNAAFEKL